MTLTWDLKIDLIIFEPPYVKLILYEPLLQSSNLTFLTYQSFLSRSGGCIGQVEVQGQQGGGIDVVRIQDVVGTQEWWGSMGLIGGVQDRRVMGRWELQGPPIIRLPPLDPLSPLKLTPPTYRPSPLHRPTLPLDLTFDPRNLNTPRPPSALCLHHPLGLPDQSD